MDTVLERIHLRFGEIVVVVNRIDRAEHHQPHQGVLWFKLILRSLNQ
jgi:hypothetical protein